MKLTNKYNLPDTLVKAITYDGHKRADYSATDFQKSPKQLWLSRRHDAEMEMDITERTWMFIGSAVHYVFEKAETPNALVEEKFITNIDGVQVSGRADHFEDSVLSDYKITSVWTVTYKSAFPDWERQLNTYAYFYRLAGFEVKSIRVVAILRDWSKSKAKGDNYPPINIQVVPLGLWTQEEQLAYIKARIKLFESYKDTPDDDIPVCELSERWHKDDKFAVMKGENKSAVRGGLCKTEAEAKAFIDTAPEKDKAKLWIQPRPGEDTKCLHYCDCREFCSHGKTLHPDTDSGE